MSKIGKMPISVKEGTTIAIEGSNVKVSGPKGDSTYTVQPGISVTFTDGKIVVTPSQKNNAVSAMFGLVRANLANLVKGVETGFEKKLELIGVGYRAQMQGETLVLSLGYSHPVKITPRNGVKFGVAENVIVVSGINKADVGEMAAHIRAVRPPEPYKGKGIKYAGEYIRRKAGKAAKAVGAK